MKKRLIIYCEGQTEEMFVERLLRNHLLVYGVKVERPVLAATSFDPQGQRGGFVHWAAIDFDLRQEFASDTDIHLRFTTLLDVYAMPPQVLQLAGYVNPPGDAFSVEHLERVLEAEFKEPRFKAYLQRHELEALLLAVPEALSAVFPDNKSALAQLHRDVASFPSPEDINHGPLTHRSARLEAAVPGYGDLKASRAYFVLAEAGLSQVRAKCPRFHAWLSHWEAWGMERDFPD